MSSPYVGEIRMFAGNFPPVGWAFCDGALLAISENTVLFQLIGTTYGGDGQQTFALPDLRGRVPMHMGNGFTLAQSGGTETVTLTVNQIPTHGHTPLCQTGPGTQASPQNGIWAASALNQYSSAAPGVPMNAGALGVTGNNLPHDNLMPYLGINFIISLFGIFPTQN